MNLKKLAAVAAASAAILSMNFGTFTGFECSLSEANAAYTEDFDYDDLDEIFSDDDMNFDYVEEYDPYYDEAAENNSKKDDSSRDKTEHSPVLVFFICLLLGMLIAGIAVGSMWAKLKTVHMKSNASDYTKPENLVLKVNNDTFLSKKVDKAAIPSNNH